ncbi:WW domain-binding protein 11 [Sinocyclocheilus rhinocerous]|uniref:WW domain-binding protein 11 n=1 Tax=Sinocyclocheilus rhinocerous TaxID=307959 RepID=UPI0007B8EB24|nr:PREDICTED: WW domain-binding protein 11-like [Sinocyclocheilus rhinocerous]
MRKEARKRELKKNKKQRMMVRAAVLKMKDPRQIIKDMEKLDEMGVCVRECVCVCERECLRESERESEKMSSALRVCVHQNAESVEVDSIPLPDMPHAPSSILIQDIPLPGAQPPSILKKSSALGKGSALSAAALAGVPRLPPGRKPPGPPPGPPPPQVLQLYANTRRTGMPPPPPPRMAPPLSLFPPPLNPNVLSAPPSIRQKSPVVTGSSSDSTPMAPPARGSAHQMPPPPGTTATIEKRAMVSGPGTSLAPPGGATISAKPQIINPKTEVTRFVPTALRVRRDRAPGRRDEEPPKPAAAAKPSQPPGAAPPGLKTKDQMYEAFMREMEGLL